MSDVKEKDITIGEIYDYSSMYYRALSNINSLVCSLTRSAQKTYTTPDFEKDQKILSCRDKVLDYIHYYKGILDICNNSNSEVPDILVRWGNKSDQQKRFYEATNNCRYSLVDMGLFDKTLAKKFDALFIEIRNYHYK